MIDGGFDDWDSLDKEEHKIRVSDSRISSTHRMRGYLDEETTLTTLKRKCEEYRRCNARFCPRCHKRAARRLRRQLRAAAPTALQLTLTMLDSPCAEEGFRRIINVWRDFEKRARQVVAVNEFVFSLEVTYNETWHWHVHGAVFGNDLEALGTLLIQLWLDTCADQSVTASRRAQGATVKPTVDALDYVVKGKLGSGRTGLWALLERASLGETAAMERWREFEDVAASRTRWQSSRDLSTRGLKAAKDAH